MKEVFYCTKCGSIDFFSSNKEGVCFECKTKDHLKPVPEKYLDKIGLMDDEEEKVFFEECVRVSPDFDESLYNKVQAYKIYRSNFLKEASAFQKAKDAGASNKAAIKAAKGQNLPKCPTCGSLNVKKISAVSKVAGASIFGLFSKTARSQFCCRNCGYKW